MLRRAFKSLDEDIRNAVRRSGRFERALEHGEFIAAAGHLEAVATRQPFVRAIRTAMAGNHAPNAITKIIADWPFEGYLTSNYDPLIENALIEIKTKGWVPVGNTDSEIRKVSGDADDVVWHVHGYLAHGDDKSELIVSSLDYARIYGDKSPLRIQLQGLLAQRRLVFIGFGFNDAELLRVLEVVGTLTRPDRPVLAVLPDTITEQERDAIFKKMNVDALYYHVDEKGSHDDLLATLRLHDHFIMRRTLAVGNDALPCEGYDDQTTGLFIYNELALKKRSTAGADVLSAILKSKIMAKLSAGPCSIDQVTEELASLAADVNSVNVGLPPEFANTTLAELHRDGHIDVIPGGMVRLTPKATTFVAEKKAIAELEHDRLRESLYARVAASGSNLTDVQRRRVAQLGMEFLVEGVKKRAIGIASALYSSRFQDFSMTTLLQSLPRYTGQSASRDEALPLVTVVRDVLLRPTEVERRVIGLMLQAQFAVHLLGFDSSTVERRLDEIGSSLFVLDSYTLIRYLAIGAKGNQSARALVQKLRAVGASVITTDRLVGEVAAYLGRTMNQYNGVDTQSNVVFRDATGRGDDNIFLDGFQNEFAIGGGANALNEYIANSCRLPIRKRNAAATVKDVLLSDGIPVVNLSEFAGYDEESMAASFDRGSSRLAERRRQADTFKGMKQTDAESEALMIVHFIRSGKLRLKEQTFSNAFFVSPTAIVSKIGVETNVNIRPALLLQMVAMLQSWSLPEMELLADTIFGEFADSNFTVVDPKRIEEVFHPLRVTSKRQIGTVVSEYEGLITAKLGRDAVNELRNYDGLDLPLVAERLGEQVLSILKKENEALKSGAKERAKAEFTRWERGEYERLKHKSKTKGKKNRAARKPKKRPPRPTR
jgi:SIR2-like protein